MLTESCRFQYQHSRKITNWGYSFDSVTELKYAVSIMEDFAFLRSPISVYFHPGTKMPTESVRLYHRRYTPDFLIRNLHTNEASWIEIKPRAYQFHPKLGYRKEIAENYVRWKRLDWTYKVVFDDEIILSADQLDEFERAMQIRSKAGFNAWFSDYRQRFACTNPIANISNRMIEYIMFGKPPLSPVKL